MSQESRRIEDTGSAQTKFEYAWRYFDLHARQRVAMFNFFLVGSGVIANAYGLLLRNPDPFFWQAGAVALVGALVCGVSFVLDMRNRQLVGYGEDALRRVEQDYLLSAAQIKPNSEAPEYAIMTRELRIGKPPPWLKHGNLFKALEVVGALGFLVAGGWSFYMALN